MKLRFVVLLIILVCCGRIAHAQNVTGVHGVADKFADVNFSDLAKLPADTTEEEHEAEEEENEQGINHYQPIPPGSKIMMEDTNVTHGGVLPPHNNGALSPAPTTSFIGTIDNLSVIPPDVNGAVGPNHLMIALNSSVAITNRSGTLISSVTLKNFWSPLSLSDVFDPKILFDPYNKRWMIVSCAERQSASSSVAIAVSKSSDPTAGWYMYKIDVDPADTAWFDYPSFGFSKKWIMVSGNIFGTSSGSFVTGKLWCFDKANLYAGGSGSYTAFATSSINFTLGPAVTYDSTLGTHFFLQDWNGSAGALRLCSVTGNVGSEVFHSSISFPSTSTHWAGSGPSGYDFAPQLGSTHLISTNDDRMQQVVYRNGYLWAVHTIFLPSSSTTRSSVQWWQMDTTGSIKQHGYVDDATTPTFYAFPSIAVNSRDDAMIGYCSFSSSQYASANYSYRSNCDASSTLESSYIYKAGEASYYKVFTGSTNRWGDYSATCVDTNGLDLWTIQEYATTQSGGTDRWSTYWAKYAAPSDGGSGTWTWTGSKSTDWFDRCNWDKLSLPNGQSDVVIPGGTTNNPTITGATGSCNTLTINTTAGGILTVNSSSSGALNVTQ